MVDTVETKIRFINQQRYTRPGENHPWEDCCEGHKELYVAMQCQDAQVEIVSAKLPSNEDFMDAQLWHSHKQWESRGYKNECRIVKRTTTDEVVDEATARQPKDEA